MAKTKIEKRILAQKALDTSKLGFGEPTFVPGHTESDISRALNWYSEHSTIKKEREWVLEYVKKNNLLTTDQFELLEKVPVDQFFWIGRICRMIFRGAVFKNKSNIFQEKMVRLIGLVEASATPTTVPNSEETKSETTEKENTIQRRLNDKIQELVSTFLVDFELWQTENIHKKTGKTTGQFDTTNWCASHNLKPVHCNRMVEEIKDEIKILEHDIANNLDGYLFSKKALQTRISTMESVIECLQKFALEKKINRKPRKRKAKDPNKLVAKMKYCKEVKELNLTSIHPVKIVGAQYLLTYNSKYKKFSLFEASGPEGLTVKGSTILGWNLDSSVTYRLRKPEKFFKAIAGQGIRKVKNGIKTLTTKPSTTKGRIGKDTVLVSVL